MPFCLHNVLFCLVLHEVKIIIKNRQIKQMKEKYSQIDSLGEATFLRREPEKKFVNRKARPAAGSNRETV